MSYALQNANDTLPNGEHTWLTVREIADVTRFSPTTILRAIRNEQLRATKVGERQYRVTQRAFDQWVQRGMPTSSEAENASPVA